MTQEEWKSKSDDFRRGWRTVQQGDDMDMTHEQYMSMSDDWKDGARYAIEHPIGPVSVQM